MLAVIAGELEFIICIEINGMTVPARPAEFLQPFLAALHWFAVHCPDVTKKWSEFCDELILMEDVEHIDSGLEPRWYNGDLMIPAGNYTVIKRNRKPKRVDILREYGREQLRHLSQLKRKELLLKKRYGSGYNPFITLLHPHPMLPLSYSNSMPEPIIHPALPPPPSLSSSTSADMNTPKRSQKKTSKRSPNRSPTVHFKGSVGVGINDMSELAEAVDAAGLQLQEVGDDDCDKFYIIKEKGTYDFDGTIAQVFVGYGATNNGKGKMLATRIKYFLTQNQINNRTKKVSTCVMFSLLYFV